MGQVPSNVEIPTLFKTEVLPKQTGWAAELSTPEGRQAAAEKFRELVLDRVRKKPPTIDFVVVHDVSKESKWADRLSGMYYWMRAMTCERRCYQKVLYAPDAAGDCVMDVLFLVYQNERWQISVGRMPESNVFAYCDDNGESVVELATPWQVQLGNHGEFHTD